MEITRNPKFAVHRNRKGVWDNFAKALERLKPGEWVFDEKIKTLADYRKVIHAMHIRGLTSVMGRRGVKGYYFKLHRKESDANTPVD